MHEESKGEPLQPQQQVFIAESELSKLSDPKVNARQVEIVLDNIKWQKNAAIQRLQAEIKEIRRLYAPVEKLGRKILKEKNTDAS